MDSTGTRDGAAAALPGAGLSVERWAEVSAAVKVSAAHRPCAVAAVSMVEQRYTVAAASTAEAATVVAGDGK
jgi:hypothetical protein